MEIGWKAGIAGQVGTKQRWRHYGATLVVVGVALGALPGCRKKTDAESSATTETTAESTPTQGEDGAAQPPAPGGSSAPAAAGGATNAQNPSVNSAGRPQQKDFSQAQRRAIERFPELGVAESPLNKMFLLRLKRFRASDPAFFENPEWPSELARQCAADLPPSTLANRPPSQ